MSQHLDACPRCLEIFDRLPPPTYYSLGRPLRPAFALSPARIDEQVDALTFQLIERVRSGGTYLLASDWLGETSLYLVLSLSATRLRRLGYSVAVSGSPFSCRQLPVRHGVDVAILLEATAFNSRSWSDATKRGRLNVLVGCSSDWNQRVDFVVRAPSSAGTKDLFNDRCSALRNKWRATRDIIVRRGLLLNAFGVDCPPGFFLSKQVPAPFVCIETPAGERTGWSSVEGQWMAWEAVRELVTPEDIRVAIEPLARFPSLADRLRFRAKIRGLAK
ncbi:MAG: hypothetical protein LAP61_22840 [Acidobacteriia bacterium]|nr:hypothetical protein [Terriglobia bacterium]